MEIYFKNDDGQIQETTLAAMLTKRLKAAGFRLDNGSFADESHQWVGIIQKSKRNSEVTVNICFEGDGNTITDIKVYEAPIKVIVDTDNQKTII